MNRHFSRVVISRAAARAGVLLLTGVLALAGLASAATQPVIARSPPLRP
jgi:hypothetical protein